MRSPRSNKDPAQSKIKKELYKIMLKKPRLYWRSCFQPELFLDLRLQYEGDMDESALGWGFQCTDGGAWGKEGVESHWLPHGPPGSFAASPAKTTPCPSPFAPPPQEGWQAHPASPGGRFTQAKINAKSGDCYSELGFTPSGIPC